MFGAVLLDPFGEGKYRYTRKICCKEMPILEMSDGAHTIFLGTQGTNEDEEPEELVKFLRFVGAQPSESENNYNDSLIERLQESIKKVKASREMGARYMTFEELLKDERKAGREEGREEEKLNTERERKRAEQAEAELEQLRKEIARLKQEL